APLRVLPRTWGRGLQTRASSSRQPLLCHNPGHRFLIGREWVAGPFIKLTKPFHPVKSQGLDEHNQPLKDHHKDIAEDCSNDSEGCKEGKLYRKVCQVERPYPKIGQRVASGPNKDLHQVETALPVSQEPKG